MPLKRALYVPVVAVLASLVLLLSVSCSTERPEGRTADEGRAGDARPGAAGEPSEGAGQPEPRASLVPVAHLTTLKESVSTEELSQVGGLAVPRGYGGMAEELLDRSDFESFDSAGAVVDHVSQTPGAGGVGPWDEVRPPGKGTEGGG